MPTRLRIDLAGYHHIINRGVDRMNIFRHDEDKKMFLQIVNKTATIHKVTVHDYCLMDNHYHLLIETESENLSTFMRIVNANYAQYFNKKTKRTGHLWQGRYSSRYITSERYLYTLIRYIEYNPIEAKISQKVGHYPYTLASTIFHNRNHQPCCNQSILLRDYDVESLSGFLNVLFSEDEMSYLQKEQKRKIEQHDKNIVISQSKSLDEYFTETNSKKERNQSMYEAYLDGYPQIEIANYLGLSKSLISRITIEKSRDSTSGV